MADPITPPVDPGAAPPTDPGATTPPGGTLLGGETTPPVAPTPPGADAPPASWLDSLPDDLKGNEALKAYKDPGEVAKALLEAQGKIQTAPESAAAYEITVPEGMPVDQTFLDAFKGWAHEHGLSQAQAAGIADKYNAFLSEQLTNFSAADKTAYETSSKELKAEWGAKFTDNLAAANKALTQFAGPDGIAALKQAGMANNPALVKMFAKIGEAISEDSIVKGGQPAGKNNPENISWNDPDTAKRLYG